MRFLKVILCCALCLLASKAHALSCAPPPEPEVMPQNALIVKAQVLDIKVGGHIPLIQDARHQDEIITFEVIDFYRAPVGQPKQFKAHLSPFFRSWGPHLQPGQQGEYLFNPREGGGWDYAGPGGCNYISEEMWGRLRQGAIPASD
ncbi:MAG: hypothetical protein NDJ24_03125 [Alphaproteobacteria bacterium]|nr:hypothetical protein [Alphaproteobacteria bacterium]